MGIGSRRENEAIAQYVNAKEGTNLTAEEVEARTRQVCAHFRTFFRARGYEVPESDEGVLFMIGTLLPSSDDPVWEEQ